MKKTITIAIISILIISGIGAVAQPNQDQLNKKTETLTISEPTIYEKNDNTQITIKEATTYLNNPPFADPYPSPDVNPVDISGVISVSYENSGILTLDVVDDDGGIYSTSIILK